MPKLYLSPSTQDWNPYVTGSGSEEESMNLLADALEPYLLSNAIRWARNAPDMTAASSIRQANGIGGFDLYLALHSNASGQGSEGANRGILAFYYPTSARGREAAELYAARLREVYPLPELVRTEPTTALGEVRQPRAPANLLEIGYHDNYADARWIETSRPQIARALALALTEYFGVPFIEPRAAQTGVVRTGGSPLRLRAYPGQAGEVLALLPNGAGVTVHGEWQGWYAVRYGELAGYAAAAFVAL